MWFWIFYLSIYKTDPDLMKLAPFYVEVWIGVTLKIIDGYNFTQQSSLTIAWYSWVHHVCFVLNIKSNCFEYM